MTVKEEVFTFTDRLNDQTLLPASQLRNLSQKEWVETTLKHDKIGLIVNNELQLAVMHWEKYKEMYKAIKHLKEQNELISKSLEDLQAALQYSERAERFEEGKSKVITGDTQDQAMNNLLKEVFKRSKTLGS